MLGIENEYQTDNFNSKHVTDVVIGVSDESQMRVRFNFSERLAVNQLCDLIKDKHNKTKTNNYRASSINKQTMEMALFLSRQMQWYNFQFV